MRARGSGELLVLQELATDSSHQPGAWPRHPPGSPPGALDCPSGQSTLSSVNVAQNSHTLWQLHALPRAHCAFCAFAQPGSTTAAEGTPGDRDLARVTSVPPPTTAPGTTSSPGQKLLSSAPDEHAPSSTVPGEGQRTTVPQCPLQPGPSRVVL